MYVSFVSDESKWLGLRICLESERIMGYHCWVTEQLSLYSHDTTRKITCVFPTYKVKD